MNNKYISQRYRILCSGFVNFLTKVNKLRTDDFNIENCEFLRNEIETSNGYLNKEWLLEKVEEVKNKRFK